MAIDYEGLLSAEQKRSLLQQRITQFASEAYQHELNKKTLESIGDTAGIESSDKALATLEAAISVHKAELESIPAEG